MNTSPQLHTTVGSMNYLNILQSEFHIHEKDHVFKGLFEQGLDSMYSHVLSMQISSFA